MLRSRFPLTIPGEALGTATAPTKHSAQQLAEQQFGTAVVVEPIVRTTPKPGTPTTPEASRGTR